jgi:hypothetical protein
VLPIEANSLFSRRIFCNNVVIGGMVPIAAPGFKNGSCGKSGAVEGFGVA